MKLHFPGLLWRTQHALRSSLSVSLTMDNVTISTVLAGLSNVTDSLSNITDPLSNATAAPAPSGGGAMSLPWDNPDNIMTKDVSDDITFSLQCFVFPILTVFGLTGNVLSMIVMLQKKLRESTTTTVLVGLAISDSLFLLTNMYRKSVCIIREFDPTLADEINAKSFRYAFPLKTAFSRVSTLLVVVITLERLVAVAFPLSVKTLITRARMIGAVIACYVITLACLAGLPPQYTYAQVGGRTYIAQTEFSLNNVDSLKAYNEYFLPIAFRYIPVLLVIIINTVIVVLIRRSSQFQKKASAGESKRDDDQRKITRMLLTVSIIYLICLLPGDILLIASDAVEGFAFFGTYHNAFLALSDLSLLFEVVNSSVNFIIYMVLNRRFNEIYMHLFCSCFKNFSLVRGSTKSGSDGTKRTKETGASVSSKPGKGSGIEVSSGYAGSGDGGIEKEGIDNPVFDE